MQLPGFHPHPQLACLQLQKILLRDRIICFDIIRVDTCACSNELSNQAVSYRVLWNCLREINYCFTKPRCALFQIENAVLFRLFTDKPFCILIPEQIVGATRLLSLMDSNQSFHRVDETRFHPADYYEIVLLNL